MKTTVRNHQCVSTRGRITRFVFALAISGHLAERADGRAPEGRLELSVVDSETGVPIPTRIRLRDGRGRTVKSRGWGQAALADHAYFDGTTVLELRRGPFRFDLDAGPEYRTRSGHFTIERHADDSERIEMRRFANLDEEGWFGADLLSARSKNDLPLLLRASQTAYASKIGFRWEDGEWTSIDRRAKGLGADALWADPRGVVWFVDQTGELTPNQLPSSDSSSLQMLGAARRAGWLVFASPTSWELPVWIAEGVVDGVIVIDGWADSKAGRRAEARGNPGDAILFPGERGAGRWREHVYNELLKIGLNIPMVAGSGSGVCDTPFGEARVYTTSNDQSDWNLTNTFVTNGPLLRASILGSPPGSKFSLEAGETLELEIALNLATREAVDYLEILKDGEVLHSVRLAEFARQKGRLPTVTFDASGWVAIRAVTEDQGRYRFARTAPFWVEAPDGPRRDDKSRAFFSAWLEEAASRFEKRDPEAYSAARLYWENPPAETND